VSRTAPILLFRAGGRLHVGHVAVGNGVAGLIQRRADDPDCSFTATSLAAGDAVHGANAGGLVCAAVDHPGHPLVAAVLGGADGAEEAAAMLRVLPGEVSRSVSLLLADAETALVATVQPGGQVEVHGAAVEDRGEAGLAELLTAVRAVEPEPEPGATPAAALAAVLERDCSPALHVALGPPGCAVFLRLFPGMELVPDLAAAPEGTPLARLAAAVAQTTSTDVELRRRARERLDRAEREALREGEEAERMAALMDSHTDDRGAMMRRMVGQAHAAELARLALEELAVPAPRGGGGGPRL